MKKILATGLIFLALCNAYAHYPLFPKDSDQKQRGVSWVAGSRVVTAEDFQPLLDNHVTWIVQTPFGWQKNYNSPALISGSGFRA